MLVSTPGCGSKSEKSKVNTSFEETRVDVCGRRFHFNPILARRFHQMMCWSQDITTTTTTTTTTSCCILTRLHHHHHHHYHQFFQQLKRFSMCICHHLLSCWLCVGVTHHPGSHGGRWNIHSRLHTPWGYTPAVVFLLTREAAHTNSKVYCYSELRIARVWSECIPGARQVEGVRLG